ncbi:MAG: nuclear transport factor 2 family protein [Deltaproteobacteria bacterium]|nr:nuclear transport factor 2 family protein [Deltaproteobacteria bacterium]
MRISRKKAMNVVMVLAAIGCFFLLKHILVSDEGRIKRVIYDGKTAIEKKDIEKVMEQVSRSYQDDYGLNKFAIFALFKRVFQEFDDINIRIEEMQITINENKQGRATILTWATAREQDKTGYIVGSAEQPCQVTFTLAKEGGRWRVIKTEGIAPEEIFL